MPRETYTQEMNAPAKVVFDVIHDYGRRLEWDSMLTKAELLDGATEAGLGVRSLCVGTWRSLFLGLETEYIRFTLGQAAAVKLTNRPPFFDEFAATIDAEDAATAAQAVQEQFLTGEESFELIQVQLMEEPDNGVTSEQIDDQHIER